MPAPLTDSIWDGWKPLWRQTPEESRTVRLMLIDDQEKRSVAILREMERKVGRKNPEALERDIARVRADAADRRTAMDIPAWDREPDVLRRMA